ncbi:MAG: DUF3791 domain-containing protein [Acutalibacteraceae bacterium]
MSKEMDFFIFLIEQYAKHRGTTADRIMEEWEALGVTQQIYNMYEMYHIEALDNAFHDIDRITAEKKAN